MSLCSMPIDILLEAFEYLEPAELLAMRRTCSALHNVSHRSFAYLFADQLRCVSFALCEEDLRILRALVQAEHISNPIREIHITSTRIVGPLFSPDAMIRRPSSVSAIRELLDDIFRCLPDMQQLRNVFIGADTSEAPFQRSSPWLLKRYTRWATRNHPTLQPINIFQEHCNDTLFRPDAIQLVLLSILQAPQLEHRMLHFRLRDASSSTLSLEDASPKHDLPDLQALSGELSLVSDRLPARLSRVTQGASLIDWQPHLQHDHSYDLVCQAKGLQDLYLKYNLASVLSRSAHISLNTINTLHLEGVSAREDSLCSFLEIMRPVIKKIRAWGVRIDDDDGHWTPVFLLLQTCSSLVDLEMHLLSCRTRHGLAVDMHTKFQTGERAYGKEQVRDLIGKLVANPRFYPFGNFTVAIPVCGRR